MIENPATGERVVFRRTSAETNGELLEYEFLFRPGGEGRQTGLPAAAPARGSRRRVRRRGLRDPPATAPAAGGRRPAGAARSALRLPRGLQNVRRGASPADDGNPPLLLRRLAPRPRGRRDPLRRIDPHGALLRVDDQ